MNFIPVLMTAMSKSDVANATDFWTAQFSSFTPATVLLTLAFALITGVLISLVYKITYRGVLYSPQFSMVLIMLTLVTAPVVMAIGSNVALSMGMVGALSIVRFRTAVKDPLDTAYMFWALTMGILLGAGLYLIAIIVVLCISVLMFVLTFVKFTSPNAYLLVVHYDEYCEGAIQSELRRSVKSSKLRSKTLTRAGAEMTYEVRLNEHTEVVTRMLDIEGVHDATLVACQSEVGA